MWALLAAHDEGFLFHHVQDGGGSDLPVVGVKHSNHLIIIKLKLCSKNQRLKVQVLMDV